MMTHLRGTPVGCAFILCRTGQKFTFLRREHNLGKTRYVVQLEGETRETSLHHSNYVKLLPMATITIKKEGCYNRPPLKESFRIQDGWNNVGGRHMIDQINNNSKVCHAVKERQTSPGYLGCSNHPGSAVEIINPI